MEEFCDRIKLALFGKKNLNIKFQLKILYFKLYCQINRHVLKKLPTDMLKHFQRLLYICGAILMLRLCKLSKLYSLSSAYIHKNCIVPMMRLFEMSYLVLYLTNLEIPY